MSARLIEAANANRPDIERGVMDPPVPSVVLVREAVALLGWATMTYQCEACRFEWEIWMALGVEGPPALREAGLYVPAPFTLGSCPAWPVKIDATPEERARFQHVTRCDGSMSHVRWREDREFAPTLIPDDAPRFVLDPWHGCGQLVMPEPALIAARRFHSEPPDIGGYGGEC